MELYTLRYVLAVADSGNFSLAAQACHVGQPALSQQIAKLEKELGVALFARNPRGATLTEAGKDFVLRAREILQRAQALQAEMSFYAGLRKGSLNLGIITSLQCINFGGMLSAFCGSYPDISVNIGEQAEQKREAVKSVLISAGFRVGAAALLFCARGRTPWPRLHRVLLWLAVLALITIPFSLVVLRQRLREIEGGELNEARKY